MISSEKKLDESELKQMLSMKLEESGEKTRIIELLRVKLVECGWRDQLKEECKQLINQHPDIEKIKVSDLVTQMTPKARNTVPDSVKKDILNEIREFVNRNIPQ